MHDRPTGFDCFFFFPNPMGSPLPLLANVFNKYILFNHFVVSKVIFSQ